MSNLKRLVFPIFASTLLCALFVTNAKADAVTFTLGNNPQPNEENVLLNAGTTGTTVFGLTNQTNIQVRFTSSTDMLTEPANGQARIEAVDGLLNGVTISIPGGSFQDIIFNPFFGAGTATITATTVGGQTFTFSYTLSNGNNFLTTVATMGALSSVSISAPGGFTDLREVRISGAQLLAALPEPTTLVLLGSGLIVGSGLLRRRRRG